MLTVAFNSFLNVLLPPRCFGCGAVASDHHTLCSKCWKACAFLAPPWCALCGVPFPYEAPEPSLCASCYRHPPLFVQGRSALAYNEGSKPFILHIKHADGTHLAQGLSQMMMRAGADLFPHTDLFIPVPLHWKRLFWRQYNQATLLARHIANKTQIPLHIDLLRRHQSTPSQGKRNHKERFANVRGAFSIRPQKVSILKGKCVTLIDDVLTTGSTLNECARILLHAGAKEVRVLTLARVTIPL